MEMHQIRYFLAVADLLNFTRAAEQCNVAQPSLTRAIKLLEDELGGDLFRREHRSTHLTPFGQRMLPLLKQSYESAVAAKDLARSIKRGGSEPISIALSLSVDVALVASSVVELYRAFPDLEVNFLRSDGPQLIAAMREGRADLACAGPLPEDWDRLESWPLFEDRFSCVMPAAHPLAGRDALESRDIAGERLLGRPYCETMGTDEPARGPGRACSDAACDHDVLRLVEAGLGIALVPDSWALGPALRRVPVGDLAASREVRIYAVAGRRRSPAASLLLKLLRARDWARPLAETRPPQESGDSRGANRGEDLRGPRPHAEVGVGPG
jgi:DNA-binding transcriptional LysR family regulator